MNSQRKCILETLNQISVSGSYSNLALNHIIKKYGITDTAFIRQVVYGVLENRNYIDYILSCFIKTAIEKIKVPTLNILRMGVYQIAFLESVPDYAAANESVELAKIFSKGQTAFINGVLRNYIRQKDNIKFPDRENDEIRWLSIKYSYEPWLLRYWLETYNVQELEKLLAAGNETPPFTVRINSLKTTPEAITEKFVSSGYAVKPGRYIEQALLIEGSGIMSETVFKDGYVQVQDESSMMAVKALDPKPGETVIDVCSAPGGKTMFIGELMKNEGKIIACDIYDHKLRLLEKTAKKHGILNIDTLIWDGTKLNESLIEKADKVLLDVPCSGLGVIRRKPEIKFTKKFEDVLALSKIQKQILDNASKYVKIGGVLVYSTCTISKLENEEIIENFIRENNDFKIEKMVQLLPEKDGTDGFFYCVLSKKNSYMQ